jgi:hypothetical protein
MGGHQGRRGWFFKGSNILSPNSLYPNLIGDMHREIDKEETTLIPLIWIYEWNKMKYIFITKTKRYNET